MKRNISTLSAGILAVGMTWNVVSAPLRIELPQETGVFNPGPGADTANAHCLQCHSVEYISTQPPLSRTYWRSAVVKMQEKYGANVPKEQLDPLVDYLTRNYGIASSVTNPPPGGVSSGAALADTTLASGSASGSALMLRHGCVGCHDSLSRKVGPAWALVAAKYRGDAAAMERVGEQIARGGSGKWGTIPMPPFPGIAPAEVKSLAEWILRTPPE